MLAGANREWWKWARTLLFLGMWAWTLPVLAVPPAIRIGRGAGSFEFVDQKGDPAKPMTVYAYLPKNQSASTAKIVFVMHGHDKNADLYRDAWIEHADQQGFLVIAPLFDKEHWGGGKYASSSVISKQGKVRDASKWSFSVVEHLFDAVKQGTGNKHPRYDIYGHSEGGQFVHRLVLLLPEARYSRAIAANPGWYTMPTLDTKYPYGLGESPVEAESLQKSLGRNFVLLLGEQDIDPNHKDLNKSPQAMAQGHFRLERGQNFFKTGQATAAKLNCPFAWKLKVVPRVAHSNTKMSRAAAAVLMEH